MCVPCVRVWSATDPKFLVYPSQAASVRCAIAFNWPEIFKNHKKNQFRKKRRKTINEKHSDPIKSLIKCVWLDSTVRRSDETVSSANLRHSNTLWQRRAVWAWTVVVWHTSMRHGKPNKKIKSPFNHRNIQPSRTLKSKKQNDIHNNEM